MATWEYAFAMASGRHGGRDHPVSGSRPAAASSASGWPSTRSKDFARRPRTRHPRRRAGLRGLELSAGGYNLLDWHFALGVVLTTAVAVHAVLRAKPLPRRDLPGRRQFLRGGALAAGSYLAWELQRPLSAGGLRGARRRFTGSYEAGSFARQRLPFDVLGRGPPAAAAGRLPSARAERAGRPAAAPDAGGGSGPRRAGALLDCTGGLYSRQRWG